MRLIQIVMAALGLLLLSGTDIFAGWFSDRDNTNTPMLRSHSQFDAFVTVATSSGVVQGAQVCPNVFLTTGHILNAELENATAGDPSWIKIIQYPMEDISFFDVTLENSVITTNYVSRFGATNLLRDYTFISVDPTVTIQNQTYLRPVMAEDDSDLITASLAGLADVFLIRPTTRFALRPDGLPDFDAGFAVDGLDEIAPLYSAPRHIAQRCPIAPHAQGTLGHSCPTEAAISGSSLVLEAQGELFLAGLHVAGGPTVRDAFNPTIRASNVAVQSRLFCGDYEAVCGQPCAQLSDVLELAEPDPDFLSTRRARIALACDHGWSACQISAYSLALEARHGTTHIQRDPALALELLRAAADNGSAAAHLDLALLLEAPVSDVEVHALAVWGGMEQAHQRTLPDMRALFALADLIPADPVAAANHHIAALERGLNTMLYRNAEHWSDHTARAVQQGLTDLGLYGGMIDGRIGRGTTEAMEALCGCEM